MITITTTDVAARVGGVKILVHARAGTGKTVLCSTAPRPIILSAEGGLLSLANIAVPAIIITKMADMYDAYRFFTGSQEAKNYDTACLDSISEIAETVLADEKGVKKDPRQAYGEMQDRVIAMCRAFRDLPEKHIYFSAKQTSNKDDVTGVSLYGPMMPGQKVGPALPYLFDEVFSLEIGRAADGSSFRYIRTSTDLQYEAKDRSGRLDPFEPPDLSHIINKITRRI